MFLFLCFFFFLPYGLLCAGLFGSFRFGLAVRKRAGTSSTMEGVSLTRSFLILKVVCCVGGGWFPPPLPSLSVTVPVISRIDAKKSHTAKNNRKKKKIIKFLLSSSPSAHSPPERKDMKRNRTARRRRRRRRRADGAEQRRIPSERSAAQSVPGALCPRCSHDPKRCGRGCAASRWVQSARRGIRGGEKCK